MNFFTKLNQTTTDERSSDLELGLLEKAPVRRITRLATRQYNETTDPENEEQSDSSGDPSSSNNQEQQHPNRQIPSHIKRKSNLEESLPRFGPCYGIDQPGMSDTKKQALEHVMTETTPNDPGVAREHYLAIMRKIEPEARKLYADKIECSEIAFAQMMMKDGCFFLQLALLILGGSKYLRYPHEDLIFGKKPKDKDIKRWIESMFFVGNQIPLVVLKELMAQKFFKDVISQGKWKEPPASALCQKVLYELLLVSHVQPHNGDRGHSDILHGLHNMIMGQEPPSQKSGIYGAADYEFDLETRDLNNTDGRNYENSPNSATGDRRKYFPSAKELEQLGIYIKLLKTGGVRSIRFKSYWLWATIYLPALPIDDVVMIFRNLIIYENSQQLETTHHKGEVNSYLRFMSDLIQTSNDVKYLQNKGIIQRSSDDQAELPEMLSMLNIEQQQLANNFRILRRKIGDYSSPPWNRVKYFLNFVAVLTLVQTVFTILSYFLSRGRHSA